MAHLIVDCEASGPCPQFGSMISFGAIVLERGLERGYRSQTIAPYSDIFAEGAYASIGMTRAEHVEKAECDLTEAVQSFDAWLATISSDRLVFWSDNPAFDWQWINHGFASAGLPNRFGFSARRIGDLAAGLKRKPGETQGWKKLRRTAHDHDPLNDARGNAEALLTLLEQHELQGWLK